MSIAVLWVEIKTYVESIGPGLGTPPRPDRCVFCGEGRVWFDGWRLVRITVLVDGKPRREPAGVQLKRVRCARKECERSWTIRPPWCYPHRSYQPDVVEAAASRYLSGEDSYATVASAFDCSWVAIWLWVGWLASLVNSAEIIARVARQIGGSIAAGLIPVTASAAGRARSPGRQRSVLSALQVLAALTLLHRSQPEPPSDPSPLRWFLTGEFLTFRKEALVTRPGFSPASCVGARAPPG